MLQLKKIDSRLMVVDRTKEEFDKLERDEWQLNGPMIIGEASIEQAIQILNEKEALDKGIWDIEDETDAIWQRGFNAAYLSCLSTHPLTGEESRGYGDWIAHNGVIPAEYEGDVVREMFIHKGVRQTSEEMFFSYKQECYLNRLDGKEVELKMEERWKDLGDRGDGKHIYSPGHFIPALSSGKVVITKIISTNK